MSSPIKVAIGSVPKDGGTYTFYRTVRPALRQRGVEMFCVSLGHKEAGLWQQEFVGDGCVLLAAESKDLKKQAQAFAEWCEEAKIDIVKQRLMDRYGYDDQSATDVLQYVASIFARGDAKDSKQ